MGEENTQEKPVKSNIESNIKYVSLSNAEIEEKIADGFIHVRTIIELLGAPKEHIQNTLKAYAGKISNDNSIILLNADFSEPKETEDSEGKLFMCFVEVEMLVKDISTVAFFCFDYMPSSVEIIAPEVLHYKAHDFSAFLNDIQAKLHAFDRFMKETLAKQKNLLRNSNRLLRNNIIIILDNYGKLKIENLSIRAGIPKEQLQPFVDVMVKENYIKKNDDFYEIVKKDE